MRDVAGTEITEGAVITWCGRQGSAQFLSVGVVRGLFEGVVSADRLGADRALKDDHAGRRRVLTHYYRRVTLTVPQYITVTGVSEQELQRRFPFEERVEELV